MFARRRGTEFRGVAAKDACDAAESQRFDIDAQQSARLGAVVDEKRARRAARQGFKAERPGAREEIDDIRARNRIAEPVRKNVEDGFAQPVGRRPDRLRTRSGKRPTAQGAADDAHDLCAARLARSL